MSDHFQQLETLYINELQGIIYPPELVRGLIFAVGASPEIPMPEQWLIWVFDQRGQLASTEQADQLTHILMSLLQQQLAQMRNEIIELPAYYRLPTKGEKDNEVELFMQGVTLGHRRLQSVWQKCWQQMSDEEPQRIAKMQRDLKHCLLMFSTFADVDLALQQAKQRGTEKLLENLPQIFSQLPKAMQTYLSLSGQLAQVLPNQFETFVAPRD